MKTKHMALTCAAAFAAVVIVSPRTLNVAFNRYVASPASYVTGLGLSVLGIAKKKETACDSLTMGVARLPGGMTQFCGPDGQMKIKP